MWLEAQEQRAQHRRHPIQDVAVVGAIVIDAEESEDDELDGLDTDMFRDCQCLHCVLESAHSPLVDADLGDALSLSTFRYLLSDEDRAMLLTMLPPIAGGYGSDEALTDIFSYLNVNSGGSDLCTQAEHFQELLAAGQLDSTSRSRLDEIRADRLGGSALLDVWQRCAAEMWPRMPSVVPLRFQAMALQEGARRLRKRGTHALPRVRTDLSKAERDTLATLRVMFVQRASAEAAVLAQIQK